MKYGKIILEKKEYLSLKKLINMSGYFTNEVAKNSILKLREEMAQAEVRDESDMPVDVIRLNTTVSIASEDGWNKTFTLVLPEKSDAKNNKISVLTPMGTAIIGYAAKDEINWDLPGGNKTLKVVKVKQANLNQEELNEMIWT